MIRRVSKSRKGFSLTEFLISILIVGVLSAGGLYSYGKYVDNERLIGAQTEIKMVNFALSMYQTNQSILASSKQLKNLGANDFDSAYATLKAANFLSSDLQFNGKFGCQAQLYQNATYKTIPTRFGNIDRYFMKYSGCNFNSSITAE